MGIRKKIIKKLPIFGRGQAQAAQQSMSQSSTSTTESPVIFEPPKPSHPRGETSPTEFIEQMIRDNQVVLFMKGSPSQPLCGFSANAAGLLSSTGHPFAHVDVIIDFEVREAIKQFSQWPTLPQVYIAGEFVGGSDIVRQMSDDGSLQEMVDAAFSSED